MICTHCGAALPPGAGFCGSCGRPAPRPASGLEGFIEGVVSVSLKEIVLIDKLTGSEILKSPVFRFLSLVAIVPLFIQVLNSPKAILYGLAVWSGVLWALLLYRLFADKDLRFRWPVLTLLFTCFVGLAMLEIYLMLPPDITSWLLQVRFLPVQFVGYFLGVGVREELTKALPLFALMLFSKRLRSPVNGLVLGMMSGIGFAAGENVYYVYRTLDGALRAVQETGQVGYFVIPVYNNVVRMAVTPFLHGCFSGIFGYFIALAAVDSRRRFALLGAGLLLSSLLHGLYDTLVGVSALFGVMIQFLTFFLLMTYVLKGRGLTSARELGGGMFSRTVMGQRLPPEMLAAAAAALARPQPAAAALGEATAQPLIEGAQPEALWPPPAETPGLGPRLIGLAGSLEGRVFELSGEALIGRDAQRCLVFLAEGAVSREHALLSPDPQGSTGWVVRRLSRTSPLYVNGVAVEEVLLGAGDQIQVGSAVLILEL